MSETKHRCPNCGGDDLGKHTSAGRGKYKDVPNLLCCTRCWTSWDPQPDGTLIRVKSRRRFTK